MELRGEKVAVIFNRVVELAAGYAFESEYERDEPLDIEADYAENISVSYTEIEDDLIIDENDTKAIDAAIEDYLRKNPPTIEWDDSY